MLVSQPALRRASCVVSCVVRHAGRELRHATVRTSLHAQLRGRNLLLLLPCCSFGIFSLLLLLFLQVTPTSVIIRRRRTARAREGLYHRPDLQHLGQSTATRPLEVFDESFGYQKQNDQGIFREQQHRFCCDRDGKLERSMRRVTKFGPAGVLDRQ